MLSNIVKTVGLNAKSILKVMAIVQVAEMLVDVNSGFKPVVTYSGAVNAIVNSNMYSGDKSKAVSALKLDGTREYYKAVNHIVKSKSLSSDKAELISILSKQKEEA